MLSVLLWNVYGPKLSPTNTRYTHLQKLIRLGVRLNRVDVLVLVESPFQGAMAINGFAESITTLPPNSKTGCRLEVYYRTATIRMHEVTGVGRATIQELSVTATNNTILLVAAHLPSRARADQEENRKELVRSLSAAILNVEKTRANHKTILAGDFNFDPFELPVISATGLLAVPTKLQANKGQHRAVGRNFPYLYNPMWSHFEDRKAGPAGTFYLSKNVVDCRFWHMFDQVMLRPDLIPYWKDTDLRILTKIGSHSLLDRNGIPDKMNVSDHLPIVFRLAV